jgi:hypothetical protein
MSDPTVSDPTLNGLTGASAAAIIPVVPTTLPVVGVPTNLESIIGLYNSSPQGNVFASSTISAIWSSGNPPTTFDAFLTAFLNYTGDPPNNPTTNLPWIESFMDDWSTATHDAYATGSSSSNSPWAQYFTNPSATLTTTTNSDWPIAVPSPTSEIAQFKAFFANFLTTLTQPVTDQSFVSQFQQALGNSVTLSANVTGLGYRSGGSFFGDLYSLTPISPPLPSYQDAYNTIFPNGTKADFTSMLQSFYSQEVASKGYFMPSQDYSDWVVQLRLTYLKAQTSSNNPLSTDTTSLASAGFEKPLILNNIFALVGSMLQSLQSVAAAQAQTLQSFTEWQAAYTNKLAQLPVFLSAQNPTNGLNDTSLITSGDKATARDSLNNTVNVNLRSILQTRSSTISDTSKQMQSNISQSTDAVSQQSNLAITIIQELQTLMSAIYK